MKVGAPVGTTRDLGTGPASAAGSWCTGSIARSAPLIYHDAGHEEVRPPADLLRP